MNMDDDGRNLIPLLRQELQSLLNLYEDAGGKRFPTKKYSAADSIAPILARISDSSAFRNQMQSYARAIHSFLEIARLRLDSVEGGNCELNSATVQAYGDGAEYSNEEKHQVHCRLLCVEIDVASPGQPFNPVSGSSQVRNGRQFWYSDCPNFAVS
jgi:hypothetical protein